MEDKKKINQHQSKTGNQRIKIDLNLLI